MPLRITNFDRIRGFYGVPAKRGVTVRCDGQVGTITSANGSHIRVRWQGEKRAWFYYHPCALDYLIDGRWLLGADFLKRVNAKIDDFNRRLNSDLED